MKERDRIAVLERRVAELEAAEGKRRHAWVARYLARERRARRIIAAYGIAGALTGASIAYQIYWPPWRLPWAVLAFTPITVPAIIVGGVVAWPLWWGHLGWGGGRTSTTPGGS
jgi:hypothetical protein